MVYICRNKGEKREKNNNVSTFIKKHWGEMLEESQSIRGWGSQIEKEKFFAIICLLEYIKFFKFCTIK